MAALPVQVWSYNIGCLVGSLVSFVIGNQLGRKQLLWIAMLTLGIGAVIQTKSYGVRDYTKGSVIAHNFNVTTGS